jgi:hypothetical protein
MMMTIKHVPLVNVFQLGELSIFFLGLSQIHQLAGTMYGHIMEHGIVEIAIGLRSQDTEIQPRLSLAYVSNT